MGEVLTRAQRLLALAHDCVAEVLAADDADLAVQYAFIARDFSVMVRLGGLAQAAALVTARSGDSPRGRAYAMVLRHLGSVLELRDAPVAATLMSAPALDYLAYTRQVLDVWAYLRGFVTSLLGEPPAEVADDEHGLTASAPAAGASDAYEDIGVG